MNGKDSFNVSNMMTICRTCLKVPREVFPMTITELNTYKSLTRKVSPGVKPQPQNPNPKPGIPHQSQQLPQTLNNYKQSGFFKPGNQQFRFGINNQPPRQNADVSMRTVRNNMLEEPIEYDFNFEQVCTFDENNVLQILENDNNNQLNCTQNETENENFQIEASVPDQQK
ncbi:hypothetical protein HF086_017278 [Spodoptera exigua]|uniref:Uncharacterized protein n=1 Tax=Spodoptera exigua TaxID=7107 RepID=A0A922M0S3_SPOEX|nr:hypothetical protein HF086_017278 [Spodoptera exigua]